MRLLASKMWNSSTNVEWDQLGGRVNGVIEK